MPVPRSILVVRLTSLGDVLLATPAVHAIRIGFPDASISWLVEGSVAALLAHQDFVDRVIEFLRRQLERCMKTAKIVEAARVFSLFRKRLNEQRYDLVLDLHGIIKSALLGMVARADRRIGFGATFAREASWALYRERIETGGQRMHKVDRNMLFASYLGVEAAARPVLRPCAEGERYVEDYLRQNDVARPLLAVNPFSSKGSEFKRWDLANYGELARRLGEETGATMMILWGPGEEEEAKALQAMAGRRAVLACATTVSQALSLMRRTALYIGGDSGIMHLAALAGTPVVAIFGPTDHLVNGPYGGAHSIVRKERSCSPCRNKRCTSRECIGSISVDDVYAAAMAAWERRKRNDG